MIDTKPATRPLKRVFNSAGAEWPSFASLIASMPKLIEPESSIFPSTVLSGSVSFACACDYEFLHASGQYVSKIRRILGNRFAVSTRWHATAIQRHLRKIHTFTLNYMRK